jgi:hypothetical protein
VIRGFWLKYGGLDDGPLAPSRVFVVDKEQPVLLLSHLILCHVDVQPVKSRNGRTLANTVRILEGELSTAAELLCKQG